ncbi:hypothetical protein QTL95_27085 [Rhizobium sp. S152]|uniref:hypothetical protein n=1 Tax=Rhizobium sp. S152 TaxID=3055038 RepID=UPI0025A978C4|nr:hypothetical protein [Rhizobium sp. S152]MDM9629554.1 hypothetical protein [Rhizobium sp. S152]
MSSSNNHFDPMASWARLSERVENQGKDIVDLRSNMNTGFQTINSAIGTLSNELRNNSKTQWPVIWSAAGVCFVVLSALGAFFYGTLSKGQDRLDVAIIKSAETSQASISRLAETTQTAIAALSEKMVTQKELDWRTQRSAEDRQRTDASVKELRDKMVPRDELDRIFANEGQWRDDIRQRLDRIEAKGG